MLPSPPPTTTASILPATACCRARSAAERSSAPGRNSRTAETSCFSTTDTRASPTVLSSWRPMLPGDAFKSATTLSRLNDGMGLTRADDRNTAQTKVPQAPHSRFYSPSRLAGWFDLTSILEPRHQHPATHGPGRTNAPTSKNIGRIMNAEVNSTHTDEHGQKCCERQEVEANCE